MNDLFKNFFLESLLLIMINSIILLLSFILGNNLFCFLIIGFFLSLYPYIIMNFIVSFIFWKKYYNKKENSLRIILMRTTYLLIGFILTSLFLFIMKKEHNSLAIILFFIFLSSYNIAFIVFRNINYIKNCLY